MILRNFGGSIAFTVVALGLAAWLGFNEGGTLGAAFGMFFIAAVLGVMETSVSLDNAVVNAAVLKDMDEKWQRRFLTWGILIAVFGMRVIFPIAIVAVAAWITPWDATMVAFTNPAEYERIVTGAHVGISGFGGAFLLLVGLTFFLDKDREHLWISQIERPFSKLGIIPLAPYILATILVVGISFLVERAEQITFLQAALAGIASYFAVQKFGDFMEREDEAGVVVRSGAASFVYLEFLDASFSFDGVIAAFAITNNIILIALGLGIGAMFVRSMTIALVRGGHLSEYRYLEAGAFWAIIALAGIMLFSIRVHTPEVVTGLIGALFIGLAFWASVRHKKAFPDEYDDKVILPTGNVVPEAEIAEAR